MFNKEGIPFFTVVIPFLCISIISFLSISYNMKLSENNLQITLKEYREFYLKNNLDNKSLDLIIENKIIEHKKQEKIFSNFIMVVTLTFFLFMGFFSFLMISIIKDVIKRYKNEKNTFYTYSRCYTFCIKS